MDRLQDGDRVLISEGCTHHRQCNDIGTVKIPAWIKNYTGKNVIIETSSGRSFPEDLSGYRLVIHCGGCMLNEREVRYRMKCAGRCRRSLYKLRYGHRTDEGHPGAESGNFPKGTVIVSGKSMSGYE